MWFLDNNFMNLIENWWNEETPKGSKMFTFVSKMKHIKLRILEWNKKHFRNIFKEKLEIEEELNKLNSEIIKNGMNNESYHLEKDLLLKQEDILAKEEVFWRQKSREKWLNEGDQNTKFFHNSTIANRAFKSITKISDGVGNLTDKPNQIAEIMVDHFHKILNNFESSNKTAQDKMLMTIPSLITVEDNKSLNKPISLDEVKSAIFSMNPDKSPGPDGFQAFFFQKCWDIIGIDLWKALEAMRNGGSLLSEINFTFLTLIPKLAIQ